MQPIANPNRMLLLVFGVLTLLGLLVGGGALLVGGEGGFVWGLVSLVFAGTFAFVLPIAWYTGKKQIAEIQALLAGEGLLAHWTFDPDEWQRHTENEYARGMAQAKKLSLWTFGISLGLMLVITLWAGALTPVVVLVDLGVAAGLTALIGGSSYVMAQTAAAHNRRGVGEVFIGGTSVYFGGRFYSWSNAGATLEKVAFESGDPSVVQFNYRQGSGDNVAHIEVRVPVPRGREDEAQQVVDQYYAAS